MFKISFGLIFILLVACNVDREPVLQKVGHAQKMFLFSRNAHGLENGDSTIQLIASKVKLEDLRKGYDSFYLRIWYWRSDTNFIVNLMGSRAVKQSRILSFTIDEANDSLFLNFHADITKNLSQMEWNNIVHMLSKNNINTSSVIDGSSNKYIVFDGVNFEVEVAWDLEYRKYKYSDPNVLAGEYLIARKFQAVLDYLHLKFGIRPYRWTKK